MTKSPFHLVAQGEERLIEEELVGSGGMAEVMRARDTNLDRTVALKRAREGAGQLSSVRGALLEEARRIAALDHPGVLPIYELGVDVRGELFFTMKLVTGETLRQRFNRLQPETRSREDIYGLLEILVRLCDTLAYAHEKGVVHRDLKPENVMLGRYGEVYLLDWGAARRYDVDSFGEGIEEDEGFGGRAPSLREVFGTPAYMPPELAFARTDLVDPRTDVFLLGALLFELMLGVPPFHAGRPEASLLQAQRGEPVADIEGARSIYGTLADVVKRAMARRRRDRFQSAQALGQALSAFLHGGSLLERRRFPAGALIINEGDAADEVFIITHGECRAFRRSDGIELTLMGPGEVFGEVAFLAATTRTASVRAVTDVTVLVLKREDLADSLQSGSWLSILVTTLARRFAEKDQRVAELEALLRERGER